MPFAHQFRLFPLLDFSDQLLLAGRSKQNRLPRFQIVQVELHILHMGHIHSDRACSAGADSDSSVWTHSAAVAAVLHVHVVVEVVPHALDAQETVTAGGEADPGQRVDEEVLLDAPTP